MKRSASMKFINKLKRCNNKILRIKKSYTMDTINITNKKENKSINNNKKLSKVYTHIFHKSDDDIFDKSPISNVRIEHTVLFMLKKK